MKTKTTKMFRRTLLTFIILNLSFIASAQQPNIDSLYTVWQDQTQPDSTRVKAYRDYIWKGYLFNNPDTAFILAEKLVAFANQNQYPKAEVQANNIQGVSFYLKGNYPEALNYYQRNLIIQEELGANNGMANSLNNIGIIYTEQGNFPKALNYYQRSLKIREEIGDKKGISITLGNIGAIYRNQGNLPKALIYNKRSLKIREEIGDKSGIASSLNNIGIIYYVQGKNSEALIYYQRSLKIKEEIGGKRGITSSLISIGNVYIKQGYYSKAITICQKSLTISKDIGSVAYQKSACQCLYEANKALGNGNAALAYHEQMLLLEDSLHSKETAKKLQQMEFAKKVLQDSITTAEKERLIEEAYQEEIRAGEKTRNIGLGITLFFILLAGSVYNRLRYVRKSKAALQVEKDRSENLLLNILPEEIAQELKEKGRADARDFDMVSILFTDFKGFTEASAKLSASELVMEINHCFEAFDGIMEKHKIEKIKTIGDAYMAAGGLPVPTDDSVKNTVLAALEMQTFITQRKAEMDDAGRPAFEMRVGIHTGPVVAGIVGVKKFQYDIWGDTVNTAARMESSGEVGKVNISQATYELLKTDPDFVFESRGKIEAKGKGKIEMYFAIRSFSEG